MMPVIIDELLAEIQPEPSPAQGTGADARPPEGQPGETLFDLLAIAREREARLVID
ncbi:hypothetical protein [Thauera butanivorans]|uniref:hypothetical protein n=1 Tax=Thauera butanivorans TaxID=86174 RepID=UPI0012FC244E|nr:hypothetical protein [Thauera butanivorans]